MPMLIFYTSLKTLENQRFSDVFEGIGRNQWHEMGLIREVRIIMSTV